jgi:HTH-like domain
MLFQRNSGVPIELNVSSSLRPSGSSGTGSTVTPSGNSERGGSLTRARPSRGTLAGKPYDEGCAPLVDSDFTSLSELMQITIALPILLTVPNFSWPIRTVSPVGRSVAGRCASAGDGRGERRSSPDARTAPKGSALFGASDQTYGYRRLHAALVRGGEQCCPELVGQLMRELGLVPCQPRPSRRSLIEQDGQAGLIPGLVRRDFFLAFLQVRTAPSLQ